MGGSHRGPATSRPALRQIVIAVVVSLPWLGIACSADPPAAPEASSSTACSSAPASAPTPTRTPDIDYATLVNDVILRALQ